MVQNIFLENRRLHDVNPLICGQEDCAPGHSYGPHARPYYLLHYVVSGKGVYSAPDGDHPVEEGQLFAILPEESTTYTADQRKPWHYIWVGFESALDLSPFFSGYVLDAPECAHLFSGLLESAHIQNGREWFICGKIYELLSLLGEGPVPGRDRASHYVKMAQNYIESNYGRELRVDGLAAELNLDRAYFSKIFKLYTGKPPQRYIVDFRLDRAAELLALRGLSPGEAAQQVGYGDIFNFSRMFRRRFGVPPSSYNRLT